MEKKPCIDQVDISNLSKEQLNSMLQEGLKDLEEGRYTDVDQAFKLIYEEIENL